jgi:insertion element IS1 protein InsB
VVFAPTASQKNIVKNGSTCTKKQQYHCKNCKKRFLDYYSYMAYNKEINTNIVALTKEGVGIRSTARLLKIAINTVMARIRQIAKGIKQPPILLNQTYEVDELCTFVKHKENRIWIVYALCRETAQVVSFNVGTESVN